MGDANMGRRIWRACPSFFLVLTNGVFLTSFITKGAQICSYVINRHSVNLARSCRFCALWPQALSFKKYMPPPLPYFKGKHLPFTPSPLRLNIFRLFVILSLT
jgi:hypothetical protein